MLKVGDRVRVVQVFTGEQERYLGLQGMVESVNVGDVVGFGNVEFAKVFFGYGLDGKPRTWAFMAQQLSVVEQARITREEW